MEFIHPAVKDVSDNLQTKAGLVPSETIMARKQVIGLYFSAHWCPPCRGFTPKLADFYKSMKENGEFEVIFISSDRTQEDFDGYFNDMPWVALPFSESDATTRLKEKYHISGIPTLILLDAENKVISEDGRREIMNGGNLIMERCGANKQ